MLSSPIAYFMVLLGLESSYIGMSWYYLLPIQCIPLRAVVYNSVKAMRLVKTHRVFG